MGSRISKVLQYLLWLVIFLVKIISFLWKVEDQLKFGTIIYVILLGENKVE